MAKVNIGLRGWRFDEDVLNDEGKVRPLKTLEPEVRQRILVLADRVVDPGVVNREVPVRPREGRFPAREGL
jgi:hypothetical protein